jgi:hypothetical protein
VRDPPCSYARASACSRTVPVLVLTHALVLFLPVTPRPGCSGQHRGSQLNRSRIRLQRRAGEAGPEERAERTRVREHAPQGPTKHPRMLQP